MTNPLQPSFKIRVYNTGCVPSSGDKYSAGGSKIPSYGDNPYMDIEMCVGDGVVYEEKASLLNTLTFTVDKYADVLLHRFFMGQHIVMWGGFDTPDGSGVQKVFTGTVTRIKTSFSDSGRIKFSVEAMNYMYTRMGKDNSWSFSYPDKDSKREFAKGKTTLTLEELITGIGKEAGMQIGEIKLPKNGANLTLTTKNPKTQIEISDWAFLSELARDYACTMWVDSPEGVEVLHFVETSQAVEAKRKYALEFLYPLQGTPDIQSNEIIRFNDPVWNRPRILRNIQVDEDISMAYAVSRTSMYIDKKTGEEKSVTAEVRIEHGKRVTYFYELNEDKVRALDNKNPKLADSIRNHPSQMKWSNDKPIAEEVPTNARYYYKEVRRVDENVAVYDKAFFGITVTATCNQDLSIKSQHPYPIRGILRYSTDVHTENYYLRGLKHIWGSAGTSTELDFIR